jgi:hypothetical protein
MGIRDGSNDTSISFEPNTFKTVSAFEFIRSSVVFIFFYFSESRLLEMAEKEA